jgi:hypothetical protein
MIGLWVSLGLAGGSLGANLSNGGFDNGLTGWQSAGDVTAGTSPGSGNGFVVLSEPGAGGRSRLYQDFNLPASPQYLYLRYGLSSTSRAAGITAPPDGFTAPSMCKKVNLGPCGLSLLHAPGREEATSPAGPPGIRSGAGLARRSGARLGGGN